VAGSYGYTFYLDRDSGTFDGWIDYTIPGYNDPETGEYFGDTSWTYTVLPGGGGTGGGTGGWAGESETVYLNFGLDPNPGLDQFSLQFSAQSMFTADSLAFELNFMIDAYAVSALDLTGTAGVDIIVAGGAGDRISGLDGNDIIFGGGGNDLILGGGGADLIDGEAGNDVMRGGGGDDVYIADSHRDQVEEECGGGDDLVRAVVSYTIADHVERLQLIGGAAIAGAGNDRDNRLDGNAAANALHGRGGDDDLRGNAGNDRLYGDDGDDRLEGGEGADRMDGGAGDDLYVADLTDRINETANGGIDTVQLVVGGSYTLPANLENLVAFEFAALRGTGNAAANVISGGRANDILDGGAGDDAIDGGAGDDRLIGGAGADLLIGGTGFDTASYAASTLALSINLATGATSGAAAGDVLSGIEALIGGSGYDTLTGDGADNRLDGGAGNDRIKGGGGDDLVIGGPGADRLDGGTGVDTLYYLGSSAGVTVSLMFGQAASGDAAGDEIAGFENVIGGNGADLITGDTHANQLGGGPGDDILSGDAGNDILTGGSGGDWLTGGDGLDTLSYAGDTAGVAIDLALRTAAGGDADGDQFNGFERVAGGEAADTLLGTDTENVLRGQSGDDILDGRGGNDVLVGGAGADQIEGGGGIDTLSYSDSPAGVYVDLFNHAAGYGDATGDSFSSIENVSGSAFGDVIYGDGSRNGIAGGGSFDYLAGGGGNDYLLGGGQSDTFRFEGGSDHDVIGDFEAGESRDIMSLGFGPAFDSMAEVMAVAEWRSDRVIFRFDADTSITVLGAFQPADFVAANFEFG